MTAEESEFNKTFNGLFDAIKDKEIAQWYIDLIKLYADTHARQMAVEAALLVDDNKIAIELLTVFSTKSPPHKNSRIYFEREKAAFVNGAKFMKEQILKQINPESKEKEDAE